MNKNPKILIIGSTGELGTKLLKYCNNKEINITAITGFNNIKKLKSQKSKFKIKYSFLLSKKLDQSNFQKFFKI